MPLSDVTRIPAQRGAAVQLAAGQTLRVVALEAAQVADLAIFGASDRREHFSPGRTIDYNGTIAIGAGSVLFSQRSSALARVVQDDVGVHDMLLAPCSAAMFERRGESSHPSCHESLCRVLERFGIDPDWISCTLNVFMDVRVAPDRTVAIYPPPVCAGDAFAIEALTDLVVGITACSSELTNGGTCKAVGFNVR